VDPEHPAAAWLTRYRDWYQANAFVLRWTEKVLVHPEGCYAGTADLLIDHAVHGPTLVDLKTMKMKPGVKLTPYKTWCYQLAAYRYALGQPVKCMNLVVNSNEPSVPFEHVWSEEEMQTGWLAFKAAHQLWCIEKNYDPSTSRTGHRSLAA
jgi:hypothetical protein